MDYTHFLLPTSRIREDGENNNSDIPIEVRIPVQIRTHRIALQHDRNTSKKNSFSMVCDPRAAIRGSIRLRHATPSYTLCKHVQIMPRKVNKGLGYDKRTEADILELERYASCISFYLSHSLGILFSTKLHRLMRHAGPHIRLFGCARRSDTDMNEFIYKTSKAAYHATNRKSSILAKQILTVRTIADEESDYQEQVMDNVWNEQDFRSTFVENILLNAAPLPQLEHNNLQYNEPSVNED